MMSIGFLVIVLACVVVLLIGAVAAVAFYALSREKRG